MMAERPQPRETAGVQVDGEHEHEDEREPEIGNGHSEDGESTCDAVGPAARAHAADDAHGYPDPNGDQHGRQSELERIGKSRRDLLGNRPAGDE